MFLFSLSNKKPKSWCNPDPVGWNLGYICIFNLSKVDESPVECQTLLLMQPMHSYSVKKESVT